MLHGFSRECFETVLCKEGVYSLEHSMYMHIIEHTIFFNETQIGSFMQNQKFDFFGNWFHTVT